MEVSLLLVTRHSATPQNNRGSHTLSKREWERLITPDLGDSVEIGRDKGDAPVTIAQARARIAGLDFHPIDPYVASIGGTVSAGRVDLPDGEEIVEVDAPGYYKEKVEIQMGTQNGEDAPMLVILPGIQGDGKGSLSKRMKKLALERGMNYVTIPNSLSIDAMDDLPVYHPGNPRVDALSTHKILEQLKSQFPKLFRRVSVAGYSYGALQGANLLRLQEEQGTNLINGSMVAISPPENLDHSMRELDGLREQYKEGAGSIALTGLKYRREVAKYGYEKFMESELSERGEGTNITEIKIADKYGSRDDMEETVDVVDRQFGHNRLPKHTKEYEEAGWWKRREMRAEHDRRLTAMTYDEYSIEYMSKDKWLVENGVSAQEMAREYSFTNAMKVIDDAPVMVLASDDDYILNSADVAALKDLEANPGKREVVKMFKTGGHVGVVWNPEVSKTVADFVFSPPEVLLADV